MALTKVAPAGIGSTPGDGYRIGSSFLHSTGVEITNINATGILTAASLDISGGIDFDGHTELDNVNIAGVVTATTFKGDGSQLTGFTAGQIPNLNGAKITTGTVAAARIDNLAASKITSGTVATARLGSGTASSSTFLRGDGSWAATGAGTGEQFVKLKNSSGALNDGGENVYAGYRAGASLASGANENTFYGTDAGRDCATGDYNVFIGHRAGENSLNSKNTAIGAESLHSQTSGQLNTAVGYQAGIKITTANYNTAVGHMTLSGDGSSHNVTGGSNVVMGYMSGYGISSGEKNVLIGYESGYDMTTGYWNSGLGHQALENVGVGTCNTALGYRAGHTINNGSNNICIGNQVTATAADTSNEITLGNSDITKLRIPGLNYYNNAGKVGINEQSPQQQLHVHSDTYYEGIFINGSGAPSVCFAAGTGTTPEWKVGIPGQNNTYFGISTGNANANKLLMDANGKTGLNGLPDTEILTVNGAQRWKYQSNNWNTGAEGAFIDYYASGSMVRLGHVNGASGSAKHIVFYSGGTERFKIASDGNFEIKSPTNVNGEQVGKFEWWNENSAGIMSKIACVREASTKAPASLAFYTSADVDSSANNSEGDITEHLRITSAGKLQQRSLGTTTNPALSAQHLYDNGITTDGNYYLQTSSMTAPALVRCVFHDNKGWMIVMQHQCVNVNGLYLSHLQNHTGTPNHATNDFQGCSQTDGLNLTPDAMWDTFGRNGEDSRMSMYAREIQTSGGSYDETQTYSSYTGGVIWNKTEFHRLFAGNFSNGQFRTGVRVTYSNNNATLYSKKGTTWSSPSLATINNGNVDQDLYFCNGEDGGDTNWSFGLMRGGTPYPRLANSGNGGGRNSITRWGIIGICEK